jgi:predicted dehydrogenase
MVGGGPKAFIGAVHRVAARMSDRYELVASALCSDRTQARSFAQELGISRGYGTFEEMAEQEAVRTDGIQVVSIVTPNDSHHAIAKTFLEHGIHVICEKPVSTHLGHAVELAAIAREAGLIFAVTYTYSGYPMVRAMREIVLGRRLGAVRMINVEYVQGWLATNLEREGSKQASWRTDPARSGPGGCLGDIATHAFHLACFVSGLRAQSVCAELTSFVEGRRVDDNVQAMIRFEGQARANLWASQIAVGNDNNLNIRIFGEKGSLAWSQESPNHVQYALLGEAVQLLSRGTAASLAKPGLPAGHPEGYYEAFAQLYEDAADLIQAKVRGDAPESAGSLLPTVMDGIEGLRFVEAALSSARDGSVWRELDGSR